MEKKDTEVKVSNTNSIEKAKEDAPIKDDVHNTQIDVAEEDCNVKNNRPETNIKTEIENTDNNHSEIIPAKKKSYKTVIGILISLLIIAFLFLLFSTIFAIITRYNSTIINGVSIKEIDVSGLTKAQALEKIQDSFNKRLSKEIVLYHNDYETNVFANQFGVIFDLEKAVDMAYSCRTYSEISLKIIMIF